jgi:hypothetical protein
VVLLDVSQDTAASCTCPRRLLSVIRLETSDCLECENGLLKQILVDEHPGWHTVSAWEMGLMVGGGDCYYDFAIAEGEVFLVVSYVFVHHVAQFMGQAEEVACCVMNEAIWCCLGIFERVGFWSHSGRVFGGIGVLLNTK